MVSKLLTFITLRLNPEIFESTHALNQSSKQDDQTFISTWIDSFAKMKIYNNKSECLSVHEYIE